MIINTIIAKNVSKTGYRRQAFWQQSTKHASSDNLKSCTGAQFCSFSVFSDSSHHNFSDTSLADARSVALTNKTCRLESRPLARLIDITTTYSGGV